MDKREETMQAFNDVFNKYMWLNKVKMEKELAGYASSEVHCIEYIGKHEDANVTKMADALYMTRGAVSKLTQKILQKGYIEVYQKPGNKKERYFRLLPEGEKVFALHEALHEEFVKRDQPVFDDVTQEQYDKFLAFLSQYDQHLDNEIKKQGLEE